MSVGSPQEVIDKTLTFQEGFGDYQRQLWALDDLSLPIEMALEQVELLATEVVPVLRKELASRRAPGVPDAPTHASLVKAKYGDAEPRQPRPNPNRIMSGPLERFGLAQWPASRPPSTCRISPVTKSADSR
jgi:hypothetical protein